LSRRLCAIRNAVKLKRPFVIVRQNKITDAICKIFLAEGLINGYTLPHSKTAKSYIVIKLKYVGINQVPIINNLQRVSRSRRRVYVSCNEVHLLLQSVSPIRLLVVSTCRGIITAEEAVHYKLGGEAICQVWLNNLRRRCEYDPRCGLFVRSVVLFVVVEKYL
jgi:small subunit ribosomal protein S8